MNESRWVTGVALLVLTLASALSGLIESMLIPLYAGSVLVPVAPVLAVLGNIAFAILGRRLDAGTPGAVVPFALWMLVVLVLSSWPRPEGDVIYPGGAGLDWVSYGVVLGGGVAGVATIIRTTPATVRPTR